ncbi:UDP-glycosyltransferase 87A1-like [Pistacia vera]|uniref:UDP-glycosyltransferase 87A1-like n=1 Tax=Pistacia vera TaxID=55513 RepID=UPI001263A7F8|nr:UDP-glycosyltransferase 87A1-like [Pistacia vera]XP_031271778.1 UDP-glycosyltransferase 87A1-like [Pistacia vera]
MDPSETKTSSMKICHVVALPYPGRGHINPIMNLCKLLVSRQPRILITFVVTEEWLSFIGSETKPDNVQFATVPNVIPSELVRALNMPGFLEAVSTKMEAPFERLLDELKFPVTAIIADTNLPWAVDVGNRRNIPVASLWPMSASVFSFLHHHELLPKNGHLPVEQSERGIEIVDYVPGLPSTRIVDLPTILHGTGTNEIGRQVLNRVLESVLRVSKAQYLLFASVYKLEAQVIENLKAQFSIPVYPIGPTIPYFQPNDNSSSISPTGLSGPNYLQWLDCQPSGSVLYVSLGSFLSVSNAQMDEIVAGVRKSGVRYLWVARGDTCRVNDGRNDMGIVVPWCDQLRVLCHSSIGGFWTHCGWNSTVEAVYAGVPMLTFPIFVDQVPNSKQIVDDWKIGYRVKKLVGSESLVTREEISELVQRFMDLDSVERKVLSKRARKLQEICQGATAEGGSSITNIDAFLKDIS